MSFCYLNNVNSNTQIYHNPSFGIRSNSAQNNKPTPIDKITQRIEEEKKKKKNKTAFAVGGSVIGLSLLVTIFNPKMSSKLIEKLRTQQYKTVHNLEKNKNDFLKSKFYSVLSNVTEWSSRALGSVNNVNSVKDTYYKHLCTEDKTFLKIHDTKKIKRLEKMDKIFRKVMQRPHEVITRWGDTLAKNTVRNSYKKASKRMDKLENLISEYVNKLPAGERAEFEIKLSQIRGQRECFSAENLETRFSKQEKLMSNLNNSIRARWKAYTGGFRNKFVKNSEHFNRNLSFWAHDMMEADKKVVMEEGARRVDFLFGNKNGTKGEYRELIEKLSKNLSEEEKNLLEKNLRKTEKSLRNANKNECEEYFDKKRDLVLGSAPTDILSSILLLTVGGVAFATSDDRDKRISRLITKIIPTFAGVITNITLTTMLFAGTKNLLCAATTGIILNRIGSKVDKARLVAKNKLPEED